MNRTTIALVSLVVGGVLGGLITLATNLYEDAHKEDVERDHVTRALLVEEANLHKALVSHRGWWGGVDVTEKLPPLLPFNTPVFDRLSDKIDILDEDVAESLVDFYGRIHFINDFQKIENESYYEAPVTRKQFYCEYYDIVSRLTNESQFYNYYQRYRLDIKKIEPLRQQRQAGKIPRCNK